MKCHYELLGLAFSATSDEIKKAHRKLALECHPDKNLHRSEEAKEEFQLIQQAYEILSDPQERAWYDRHRDEILEASHADTCKDDALDVYQYFNASCFKGYNDDEKGFYTVYCDVFQRIAAEDERYRDEDDIVAPDFGNSDSSYEDIVHNFYAYWQSYCTAKTFVWMEKHSLSEHRKAGVGRQVLRMVEKENKKLRDQLRKQRNEEVRELVSFVRKRDKRVHAHKKLVEEQNAEKTKKFQDQRKKQMEERQKNLENYQESEWSAMSQFEDHFNEIEANLDSAFGSEDASAMEGLYCAACDKDFRSSKSLENHLNSKKHKENVLILKHLMQEEEEQMEKDEQSSRENLELPDMSYYGDVNDLSEEDELPEKVSKKKKKKAKKNINISADNEEELEIYTEENGVKNSDSEINEEEISEAIVSNDIDVEEENIFSINSQRKDGKKKKNRKKAAMCNNDNDLSEEIDDGLNAKLDEMKLSDEKTSSTEPNAEPSPADISPMQMDPSKANTKKKAGKSKGSKKPSKQSTNEVKEEENVKVSTICEKCNKDFHSRNKLFDHLKESGHAVYLGSSASLKASKTDAKTTGKNKRLNR